MKQRWLVWLARLLGQFPLVEGGDGAPRATVDALPVNLGDARSWTRDFSSRSRKGLIRKPAVLRRSLPWLVYSMVVVTAVVGLNLYDKFDDFYTSEKQEEKAARAGRRTERTDDYVSLCEYFTLGLATSAYGVSAWVFSDSVIMLAKHLAEADDILGLSPPAPQRWLAGWMCALLAVLVTDATVWLVTGANTLVDSIWDIPLYLTYYICFTSEVLFMSDASAIGSRLRAINKILAAASPYPGHRTSHGTPVLLPRTLTVQRVARAHLLACHAMDTVSRRYGAPMVLDMLALLLNLVITTYFFLEHMLPYSDPPSDYTLILMELIFACMHFSRIVMLVEPAAAAEREAERTGELVGYLCSTVSYDCIMYDQLRALAVQLRHQRATFSSCGLFEMNRPTIISIIGAVSTYLLVLLQIKPAPAPAPAPHPQLRYNDTSSET